MITKLIGLGKSLQCDILLGTHVDRGQLSGGGASILVVRPAPNRVTESPAEKWQIVLLNRTKTNSSNPVLQNKEYMQQNYS